jgi:stage III sporulation protein SpoIIIAA
MCKALASYLLNLHIPVCDIDVAAGGAAPNSLLFLGRPGVGKTTVIREMARVLADDLHKRVVIVDTSNEIGGDGDVPHPAIGGARRMQVPDPSLQHRIMVGSLPS